MPGYLKNRWRESRWQRIARYRLGNGMRGGKYWEKEEKKKCRICGIEDDTSEYVWECTEWREEIWQETIGEVL